MQQPIEIDNRLYTSILQWCDANGIEPMKYIEKALRERLATDKYGDLNKMIRKEELEKPADTKPEVQVVVQEKKEDLPLIKAVVEEPVQKIDEKPIETAPETSEPSGVKENPIKKKRTLKSK